MSVQKRGLWSMVSEAPPVFVGLAGSVILALEGKILQPLFTLLLVAIHRYSGRFLSRVYLTSDEVADWTAVRTLTTVCCLALPFYLAVTMTSPS
ncbi:MAG: hypothetical protein AB1792_07710 [Candidatus Zixiibacteriota bacterium]